MNVTKKTYELGFLGFVENLGGWGFRVQFSSGGVIEVGIFMWKFWFIFCFKLLLELVLFICVLHPMFFISECYVEDLRSGC